MAIADHPLLSVAIIDDEKRIISLLEKIIDWGRFHSVVIGEAHDGLDGLRLIKEKKPQIVLSDIRMPGKNGIEMMAEAKKCGAETLFIFVSGHDEFEYAQDALNHGALGYILKPIDKMKLEELIEKAVNIIRVNEETRALKEMADSNMEAYIVDYYGNETLYSFYDSDMEKVLVSAIKRNRAQETDEILGNIFAEAAKKGLTCAQIKKMELEIMSGVTRDLAKLDLRKRFGDYYANFLKDCDDIADAKKSLFRFVHGVLEAVDEYKKDSLENVIEKAKSFIAENISRDVSLSKVAEQVYMNPTYFSELFKKETGRTFVEYVTKYKLDVAKDYLKNTNFKIEEISNRVGYENIKYFYTVFKKNEGVTPREYRELKIW